MIFKIFKRPIQISSTKLNLLLVAYFIVALNFTLVKKIYTIVSGLDDPGFFFILSIPCFFFAAFSLIFSLFIWKPITKPLFIFVLLASACVNYGAYNFGIIFNKDMMTNIFETTTAEAASYLNLKLALWIFLTGILPAVLLFFVDIKYTALRTEIFRKAVILVTSLSVILLIAAFYYKDYASIARNNPKMQKDIVPTYYLASAVKYVKGKYFTPPMVYEKIGTDAKRVVEEKNERYLVVFLVGETARSQNYQLNGYSRETNAYTKDIPNLVSFRHVTSCGTATAVSLPCMFSLLGKENYSEEKFESQDNVVDILSRGGINAVWIDNNTGCKGVCRGIRSYSTTNMSELDCSGEECTDDVMLKVLDDKINSFKGKDGIVFLHLLGSHGPTYYKRYPESHARFKPDCQTSDLQKCSDAEIVNSYDNTILFTDYLMSRVISELGKHDKNYYTAIVYVSDHGESLGENGVYLHGMPYQIAPQQQTHVPFMVWLSDKMRKHKRIDMNCLKENAKENSFSHDNISHTLLNLLDIRTDAYLKNKDILAMCEK